MNTKWITPLIIFGGTLAGSVGFATPASIAQAQVSTAWYQVFSSHDSADGIAGLQVVFAKYPDLFDSFNKENLISVKLTWTVYEYQGASTCRPNDHRLLFEAPLAVSEACYLNSNKFRSCRTFFSKQLPPDGDPCARQ